MAESIVLSPGAINRTIQNIINPDTSQPFPVTIEGSPPPEDYVRIDHVSSVVPSPRYEEPEPIDPEGLRKGWLFYYQSSGLTSMLGLIQKCVPECLDVTALWEQSSQLFKNLHEWSRVDKFIDLVLGRLQHLEDQAAA